jgi:hypothetical protein
LLVQHGCVAHQSLTRTVWICAMSDTTRDESPDQGDQPELEEWFDSPPELPEPVVDQLTPFVVTSFGSEPSPRIEDATPAEGGSTPPSPAADRGSLPGLEPDEPASTPATSSPQADTPPSTSEPAPPAAAEQARFGAGEWTDDQLDHWFEHNYGGLDQFREDARAGKIPPSLWGDIMVELRQMESPELGLGEPEPLTDSSKPLKDRVDDQLLSAAFLSGEASFSRLPPDLKAALRDHIESTPAPAGWASHDRTTTTVTLPDGSQLTEATDPTNLSPATRSLRDRGGAAVELPDDELDLIEAGAPATRTGGISMGPLIAGGGALAVAIVAAAFVFLGGGDGADDGAPEAAASGVPAAAAAGDTGAVGCATARDQQLILDLSSPDVQPAMPRSFAADSRDDSAFPSPQLDWSAVPPETTEIAIHVMSLLDERAEAYQADPNLWWEGTLTVGTPAGIPLGRTRWTVTGIDPAVTALPRTSLSRPLPAGITEQDRSGTGTSRDGVDLSNKFIGADSDGEYYLFTVFALCDPVAGEPDEYEPGWFQRHAVAIGWFFTRAAW